MMILELLDNKKTHLFSNSSYGLVLLEIGNTIIYANNLGYSNLILESCSPHKFLSGQAV